jgi:hypothetical protein
VIFEWGGKKFSNQEGLAEILSCGYFREGHAWGSVRCGWEVALPWEEVWALLVRSTQSQLVAHPAAGMGRERMARMPEPVKQGDLKSEGQRLWLSMWPAAFAEAQHEMWALCEGWLIGKSASSAHAKPASKKKPKSKGKAKEATASVELPQRASTTRRL